MASVELDVSGEVSHTDNVKWAASFGCEAIVLQQHGPAGGNPLYEFSGERPALEALVADYAAQCGSDSRDVDFYRSLIVESPDDD